jgi:hypothetical protein
MEPRARGAKTMRIQRLQRLQRIQADLVISCLVPVIGIRGRGPALNLAKGRRRDP